MPERNDAKKAELEREHKQSEEQIQALLGQSRPKNLRQGVVSGVGNIVGGAVGAVGVAVIAPVAGMAAGAQSGGVLGAATGLVGGAVAGAVGGVALAVGGAVSGVSQVVRGVAAVPKSITEPRKGKWWDENHGVWVETNLETEAGLLTNVPSNDEDILGDARKDAEHRSSVTSGAPTEVKEMYYYDILGVDSNAEPSVIKHQYYMMARKYHPDKVGKDDIEAANKFKDAAEAYQVLSDPSLRKKYNEEGREGLSADKTEAADGAMQVDPALLFAFLLTGGSLGDKTEAADGAMQVDPALLFAFLFGSDQFKNYVGTLAVATAASVADSSKVSPTMSLKLQKRRCTRLAILLADRLKPWADEEYDLAKTLWATEATELAKASYGHELVTLIGKVYSIAAVQFLGSLDAGIGMPGISKWATSHYTEMKRGHQKNVQQVNTIKATMEIAQAQAHAQEALQTAETEEDKQKASKAIEEEIGAATLKLMWMTTTVDITTTLHETCQMVLYDKSVDKDVRKRRGHGLKALG
eukprot:CAMPEP_0172519720 /NCGR_PEP_ID=MMETSP1066-20121228/291584_1 /TAXON_ID=671091 /ORGANISM="Coscinodiscus wailesii, Strain CCMP2513" /LENGTH=524 /DNA_ID=CAMNT_0013302355 /DNA_START=125 /DNA_END=1696 /DNA_ORIENTATION=-